MERKASFREKLKKCVKLTPFQVRCHFSYNLNNFSHVGGRGSMEVRTPCCQFSAQISTTKDRGIRLERLTRHDKYQHFSGMIKRAPQEPIIN